MTLTCLFVDDNMDSLSMMSGYSEQHPETHQLAVFPRPKETLDYLLTHPGSVNVVFSDIKLPEMSGLELLEQVHRQLGTRAPQFVLFTGYTHYSIANIAQPITDILYKPVFYSQFEDAIQRVRTKLVNLPAQLSFNEFLSSHSSTRPVFVRNLDKVNLIIGQKNNYLVSARWHQLQNHFVDFMQIHPDFLLNPEYFDRLQSNSLLTKSSHVLPVDVQLIPHLSL